MGKHNKSSVWQKIKIAHIGTTYYGGGGEMIPLLALQEGINQRYKEQFFRPNILSLDFFEAWFVYVWVLYLNIWVYIPWVFLVPMKAKGMSDTPELKLQVAVNHPEGAGNQTWVLLCRSSQCSLSSELLQLPQYFYIFNVFKTLMIQTQFFFKAKSIGS